MCCVHAPRFTQCPPCRGFTPALAEFYESHKENEDANDLEIVFVSSDRDEASFAEYYGEMPWLALPFADSAAKQALSERFGVRGIPMLVLLDGFTGELKLDNARGHIASCGGDTASVIEVWGAL